MNNKTATAIAIASLVVSLVVGFIALKSSFPSSQRVGGVGGKLAENYDPYLKINGGFFTALPVYTQSTLEADQDATFKGGTVNITTANTATSTLVVGCIQFYATSTATALKFQASTTPGVMYSTYGTCPNL